MFSFFKKKKDDVKVQEEELQEQIQEEVQTKLEPEEIYANPVEVKEEEIIQEEVLQEQIQADNRESVKYEKIKETGPAHDKVFTMAVYHDDIQLGYGSGKSKREAEQQAAKAALEKLAK